MDQFNSYVIHRNMFLDADTRKLDMESDLFNDIGQPVPEDGLHIDTDAWGWWNGGLANLLANLGNGLATTLYFRGAAIFSNFDDAKNDYLMNPHMELEGDLDPVTAHVPFGMAVPMWRAKTHEERRGGEQHEGSDSVLVSVTIILFWQPLV